MPKDAWTPYGLEAIRHAHLVRKRILGALLLLVLLALVFSAFQVTTTRSLDIFANGNKVNGPGGIQIEEPARVDKKDHVTVGIEPGKVTQVNSSSSIGSSTITRSSLPSFDRAAPFNWNTYLFLYGPYVLLGLAMWYFAKRRGKHDEVNFGVYKGALPLELITASHQGEVFTKSWVKQSIFGKRRSDHLPREVASVGPMSVEEES